MANFCVVRDEQTDLAKVVAESEVNDRDEPSFTSTDAALCKREADWINGVEREHPDGGVSLRSPHTGIVHQWEALECV